MKKIIIELKNLSKIYQTEEIETLALDGVNLQIRAGDYLSISGPSGCGKSTLLSIMGLLDTASSGQYFIDNEDVSALSLYDSAKIRNRKLGFVFQSFNLIDELSVFDNVALPLRYNPQKFSQAEVEERVKFCLDSVDMSHRINHKPNQLSGGQQQRIAIARSLVNKPSILLVDEPTGNLDSKSGDQVLAILQDLNNQGVTICMVTHDPRYADFARTKLKLHDGKLLSDTELRRVI